MVVKENSVLWSSCHSFHESSLLMEKFLYTWSYFGRKTNLLLLRVILLSLLLLEAKNIDKCIAIEFEISFKNRIPIISIPWFGSFQFWYYLHARLQLKLGNLSLIRLSKYQHHVLIGVIIWVPKLCSYLINIVWCKESLKITQICGLFHRLYLKYVRLIHIYRSNLYEFFCSKYVQ